MSLALILGLATWALWPRDAAAPEANGIAPSSGRNRKYTLRFAPGLYMPDRRPMDLGTPLQGLKKVAAAFERLYPDTHIEFTEAPVGSREYLVTQLAADQAPEILNVNVEDVWQDVQKGWYVGLDKYLEQPNPFVPKGQPGSRQWWDQFKYEALSRGKAAPDGKMYCLTFDMVETGIFYNKDIFRKLGLKEPKDWPEFMAAQEKIQKAGLIPLLLGNVEVADWGMDLIFDQVYGELLPGMNLHKDPVREETLAGYLDWDEIAFLYGKGFFTRRDPRFVETFRILKEWRRYWPKAMVTDYVKQFVTQKAAMWWSGSWTVNRLMRDPDVTFDWGVFYLPPIPRVSCRFADGHQQVVIGGAGTQFEVTKTAFNDTHDPATSVKLKRAIAFLQYLTLPQNTDRVVNEIVAFLPNIVGTEPNPSLMPFHEFLKRPCSKTKWLYTFDLRFNEIYRRMLELFLNDGISEDEFLTWMESNLRTASETVVRRKNLDLSKFESAWEANAVLRARFRELPSGP